MRALAAWSVGLALALPVVVPVVAAEDEVQRARSELEQVRREADEVTAKIEDAWAHQYTLESRISSITSARDAAEATRRNVLSELEEIAVRLYMSLSSGEGLSVVMVSGSVAFTAAVQYLDVASSEGQEALDRLRISQAVLEQQATELEAALEQHEKVTADLQQLAAEVSNKLAEAQLRYEEVLRAEEEARRAAEETTTTTSTTSTTAPTTTTSPTTTTTEATTTTAATTTTVTAPTPTTTTVAGDTVGGACPVQGAVSFVDSWGAPRSGGRTHEGIDMIAARGTPVAAIYSGTLTELGSSTLGGITIWFRAGNGDEYYYAHLDGYVEGLFEGQSVVEGEIIAYVGSTGNAPDYLPHLHFESHPGGGAAVNPYALLKSICG